jgi:DNA-binding FrmR family transcriptional regulator
MGHAVHKKKKLLHRVRRIRGQLQAIERALEEGADFNEMIRSLAAARGAISGVMAKIIEDHVHSYLVDPERKPSKSEEEAAKELLDVVGTYIR